MLPYNNYQLIAKYIARLEMLVERAINFLCLNVPMKCGRISKPLAFVYSGVRNAQT
jgi:hypothetical protein